MAPSPLVRGARPSRPAASHVLLAAVCALGGACGQGALEPPEASPSAAPPEEAGDETALLDEAHAPTAPPPRVGSVPAGTSIVLITVDTLRRDHLSLHGYRRPTSPRIDALAAEGLTFDAALAPTATTYPSHLSMLTGVYPRQHGRTSNLRGVERPFASRPGRLVSLAHALAEEGYETAAFVSSLVLHEQTGISDGFATFSSPARDVRSTDARETTDRVLGFLEGRAVDRPLFLWVHYWDPHEPNRPVEPWPAAEGEEEALERWMDERGIDAPRVVAQVLHNEDRWRSFFGGKPPKEVPGERASRRLVARLVDRYDGDVRFLDEHLGRLLAGLDAHGIGGRAITVLTADHGQSLGEDRLLGHGVVTNVNTFVPLVVRFPEGVLAEELRGARVDALVSLVDLAPTLLGRFPPEFLAGFREQVAGEDVLSGAFARPFAYAAEASGFHGGAPNELRAALLTRRWKLLHDAEKGDRLFDLAGAGEGADVAGEHPELAASLRKVLDALLWDGRAEDLEEAAAEGELADDLVENLRALGYVGDD